jgi:hypothetical protein
MFFLNVHILYHELRVITDLEEGGDIIAQNSKCHLYKTFSAKSEAPILFWELGAGGGDS